MVTTNIGTLKINKLTQSQYEKALQEGKIKEDEFYLTPDTTEAEFVELGDIITGLANEIQNVSEIIKEIPRHNITYGTGEPSGGSPGDLYIQIFNN